MELLLSRKGHESVLEAKSYLAPTRKQMKVPKDNQKKVLHVDHAENLPESTQSSQSKGRKAGVDPKDTKHLVVEILVNLSDTEIQIENFPLSNEIMKQRKSELEAWKSENGTGAGDAHTRFRILKFVKNVTKMSTFLIISHASLLNEKMAKEITQGNVENVLKFMKDFWEKSGKMLWYGACEEIVEYWAEQNMNLLQRSSSDTNCRSDGFNIRKTVNSILVDKTNRRFTKDRNGAIV
ncbi:hypothetical protein H4Q26_016769 [Puccinia striiformis f. sp. tritici PST-130]|nr:hypothetical protein H4Q26_016769 [Puccinia striiformis f. sp. tritici PST-130]